MRIHASLENALGLALEAMSEAARDSLRGAVPLSEARRLVAAALSDAATDAVFELAIESALEHLRERIAADSAPRSFIDSNPLHPNFGRGGYRR